MACHPAMYGFVRAFVLHFSYFARSRSVDQLRLAVRIDVCTTPEARETEHMFHYYNIVGAVAHEPEDGEGGTRRLAGPSKPGTSPSATFSPSTAGCKFTARQV